MKTTKMLTILVLALCLAMDVANADFTFGTPMNLGPTVNSSTFDGSPDISADGLMLYFDSFRPGGLGNWDIWVTTKQTTNGDWSAATLLLPPVNSEFGDSGPCISSDGLSLYFASDRPGGYGSYDIWVTTRETTEDSWGPPVNLGPKVNSFLYDNHPSISSDGLTLYFDSYFLFGGYGSADLWVTTRVTKNDPWGEPINLGPRVNTPNREYSPCISSDDLTLLFERRTENRHIRLTTRRTTDEDWGTSVNLGPPVNTSYTYTDAADPSISVDGSILYFVSDRPGGVGDADLWQVPIVPVVDLNGDGIVNCADICILVDYWHTDESLCDIGPTPLGDGIVDVQDLVVLAEYLTKRVVDLNLVAHYEFGGNAHDSSGNGLHGRLVGGARIVIDAERDYVLSLDGVDSYVDCGNDPHFDITDEITLAAWIKVNAFDKSNQAIITKGNLTWKLQRCAESNRIGFYCPGLSPNWRACGDENVNDGQWHHVAGVYDSSNIYLYVDGVPSYSGVATGTIKTSTFPVLIGQNAELPTRLWTGLIDDVRIYDQALSAEEIEALAK